MFKLDCDLSQVPTYPKTLEKSADVNILLHISDYKNKWDFPLTLAFTYDRKNPEEKFL